ncbi:MAG: hypothetical protein V1912_04160 [bacterium]
MRSIVYKVLTGAVVVGTLAFGGTALATPGSTPADSTAVVQPAGQDQLAPTGASEAAAATEVDTDDIQFEDENGLDDATEVSAPETEGSESAEVAESAEQPGDDGPGGHADEPGNPNADHQFEGVE